ncbi:hypothetical protein OU5_P0425 (plasmid) [Pseudomonas mandelii JR-1]|uniref:Uncharacterized protein n=1 Tax=Pseudomonas mandelii JR-1 TaxID=1147786 RepID=A0A024ELN4_9PSED|nr:hypothetical protein OU5_P0425 [Pseudomonas mandelii JR-1]
MPKRNADGAVLFVLPSLTSFIESFSKLPSHRSAKMQFSMFVALGLQITKG